MRTALMFLLTILLACGSAVRKPIPIFGPINSSEKVSIGETPWITHDFEGGMVRVTLWCVGIKEYNVQQMLNSGYTHTIGIGLLIRNDSDGKVSAPVPSFHIVDGFKNNIACTDYSQLGGNISTDIYPHSETQYILYFGTSYGGDYIQQLNSFDLFCRIWIENPGLRKWEWSEPFKVKAYK